MRFQRIVRDAEQMVVLQIFGTLDAIEAPLLVPECTALVEGVKTGHYRKVVLELKGLRLIDATGISVLVKLHTAVVTAGGECVWQNPQPQPRAVFKFLKSIRSIDIRWEA